MPNHRLQYNAQQTTQVNVTYFTYTVFITIDVGGLEFSFYIFSFY